MKEGRNLWAAVGPATSAGFTVLSCIALGLGLGWALDTYLFLYPWGLMFGGLLGGAAGLYSVYRQICG